jgi:RNA polymerase sigma-70 factor (ECF subfamily)
MPSFAELMRRCNRRLFRVVRGIVPSDAEAEDVCQDAWLRGYRYIARLDDGSKFSTWIVRIGRRCALARVGSKSVVSLDALHLAATEVDDAQPEGRIDLQRLARRVERAIDNLAPSYRAVVLLRDVENMSTSEVAVVLQLSEQNVRVRLHRARARLRERIAHEYGESLAEVFRFDGERCARLAAAVLARVQRRPDAGGYNEATYATKSAASVSDRPRSSTSS